MRIQPSDFFIVSGVTLVVLGFVYDLSLAGLPYPDPTPEMQAKWVFHKGVAEKVMTTGTIILTGVAFGKPFSGQGDGPKSNSRNSARGNRRDGRFVRRADVGSDSQRASSRH